jgi:predicted RNA-binding Zn ribbon-like protein
VPPTPSSTTQSALERQPGGRTPAPGDLGLVQSFVNTSWDLDHDGEERLGSPKELAGWLVGHGLLEPAAKLTTADLTRALHFREGLRALLFVNNGAAPDPEAIERLNRALGAAALTVRFDGDAMPELSSAGRDLDGALGSLAGTVALARIDGSWARLKACRGVHCGWAFYDHSRNRSGSWCSMSVCGSRAKAREYRRRKGS